MKKKVELELGNRFLEVEGDKLVRWPRGNRLIFDSGWDGQGVTLNISTSPLKSDNWRNTVRLTGKDWKRVARAVGKIIAHCESERLKKR